MAQQADTPEKACNCIEFRAHATAIWLSGPDQCNQLSSAMLLQEGGEMKVGQHVAGA